MSLRPCIECKRHVRSAERACPFCGAFLPAAPGRAPIVVPRTGRMAIVAFGAMTSTLAACECAIAPEYGAPPIDASLDAPRQDAAASDAPASPEMDAALTPPDDVGGDASRDDAAAQPPDAAQDPDAAEEPDVGGPVLLYGGPGT